MGSRRLELRFGLPALCGGALITALAPSIAHAGPSVSVHVEAAVARPLGETKADQFGWGGSAVIAPELVLARVIGLELGVGVLGLTDGPGPDPKGVAPSKGGFAAFSTIGPRIRPFATLAKGHGAIGLDGFWMSGGLGGGLTGGALKPTLRTSIGFDAMAPGFAAGPYIGYFQMIEPDAGPRPEDARILVFGLHGALAPPARPIVVNPDRDGDGIPNAKDACPDVAEDKDGFEDDDGCPETNDDRDKDGIPDVQDRCPDEPEDKDGFQDADGCPDLDNDQDGLPDAKDLCPNEPEDKDGFQDADGCPDPDNDRDGFLDAVDRCPDEPETVNGFNDDDGCPDTADLHVDGDSIVLEDRVHFDAGNAKVKVGSWALLERLAQFLNEHPEYALVHVDGHADDTGTAPYNLVLSAERGRSVRDMLVRYGVDASRLTIEAYGETKPRENGATEKARSANRRVELTILTREPLKESKLSPDTAQVSKEGGASR
jgi:outer membrane protein OmpA-like peptidoglycan-associated protein